MTQREQLLSLFRMYSNRLTLGQIMQTTLAAEYRARMTELRHQGYVIHLQRGATPSENLYTCIPPEESGQLRMIS